jgi:hypothetical protein
MQHPNINASMVKKISMYVDNELPTNDLAKFEVLAAKNPTLTAAIEDQKKFREYVRDNIRRPMVTHDLLNSIRQKIQNSH